MTTQIPKPKIKTNSCPKCGGDVNWYPAYHIDQSSGSLIETEGYSLAQCTVCQVVTHTGSKLCQGNVCEWHELCINCGEEICGDYATNEDGYPFHDVCENPKDIRMREIAGY